MAIDVTPITPHPRDPMLDTQPTQEREGKEGLEPPIPTSSIPTPCRLCVDDEREGVPQFVECVEEGEEGRTGRGDALTLIDAVRG